jgi:hypothetical protein
MAFVVVAQYRVRAGEQARVADAGSGLTWSLSRTDRAARSPWSRMAKP